MRLRPSSVKKDKGSHKETEAAIKKAVGDLAKLISSKPDPVPLDLSPLLESLQQSHVEINSTLNGLKQHVEDQLSKLPEGKKPTYHFEIKRNNVGLIQEVIATPEDSTNEALVNKNIKEILYSKEPK